MEIQFWKRLALIERRKAMASLNYSAIYQEEMPSYPLPPSLAVGYRDLDRLVREKLVEMLGDNVEEFTEDQYRKALRRVIRDATGTTPTDELRATELIDVRAAGRLGGEKAYKVNGKLTTAVEARSAEPGGHRLSGLDVAAKAAELLAARGRTAEDASSEEYLAALEDADAVLAYSRNGDAEPAVEETMSVQELRWRRENLLAEVAEQRCREAGDATREGFVRRYEELLAEHMPDDEKGGR
jgi:hypothetical protein